MSILTCALISVLQLRSSESEFSCILFSTPSCLRYPGCTAGPAAGQLSSRSHPCEMPQRPRLHCGPLPSTHRAPKTSQPAGKPLDKDRETGKERDPGLRHFLTGSQAVTASPPGHTRAPKPLRKCQAPSKCLISRAKLNLSLPCNWKSPGDLIQVTESTWRQSRGLRLSS